MLNELIEKYNDALASVNKENEEIALIFHESLPKAKGRINTSKGAVQHAKQSMSNCTCMAEMNSLQASLSKSKEDVEASVLLASNLERRLEALRMGLGARASALRQAQHDLWMEKADQILAGINIPDDLISALERAAAAKGVAKLGHQSIFFADLIKQKMGKFDIERVNDIKQELMNEMGIEPPSITLSV